MEIREDDLSGEAVAALLHEHLEDMYATTPAESVHALDLEALRAPHVTFFAAWEGATLLGCGALQELDARTGELKSMRTARTHRRRGVAAAILARLVEVATARGYARLYLETGAMEAFAPARALYAARGFVACGPFGAYRDDPNSVFMTLALSSKAEEGT